MIDFEELISNHTPTEVEDAMRAFDMMVALTAGTLTKLIKEDPTAAVIATQAEMESDLNDLVEMVAYLQYIHKALFSMRIRVEEAPE